MCYNEKGLAEVTQMFSSPLSPFLNENSTQIK